MCCINSKVCHTKTIKVLVYTAIKTQPYKLDL